MMKSGEQKYKDEYAILEKLYNTLSDGKCARLAVIKEEEKDFIDSLFLLTTKKVIYCANIAEDSSEDNDYVKKVKEHAEKEGSEVVVLKAKLEAELADLSPEDRAEFLKELGIETTGLEKLIKKSYKLLGLMSFLTAGPTESRAWTIPIGTKAPQAAGVIHTDFERGFIRAEVVDYNTLMECGSYNVAKEKGKVRSEGKDYIVREGDVILFRFNV
jgi:GTP-binding protein YchF